MKALSIQQPWAWLIVSRHKPIENRSWATSYRGPLYIHAGKSFDHEGHAWVRETFPHIPLPKPHEFLRGGIIGQAILAGCVKQSDSPWFFGPHGFVMRDARPIPFLPCRGALGLFNPTQIIGGQPCAR